MDYELTTPLTKDDLAMLKTGDRIALSGSVLTMRDASGKRLAADINRGCAPVDVDGQTILYLGPTPPRPGAVIGAAGPTTSARMDKYVPQLLEHGVRLFIGKGRRSDETRRKTAEAGGVYMVAVGGVGALLSKHISGSVIAAYGDLGPEAIYRLELSGFPLTVANDIAGGDLFAEEWGKWKS